MRNGWLGSTVDANPVSVDIKICKRVGERTLSERKYRTDQIRKGGEMTAGKAVWCPAKLVDEENIKRGLRGGAVRLGSRLRQ